MLRSFIFTVALYLVMSQIGAPLHHNKLCFRPPSGLTNAHVVSHRVAINTVKMSFRDKSASEILYRETSNTHFVDVVYLFN